MKKLILIPVILIACMMLLERASASVNPKTIIEDVNKNRQTPLVEDPLLDKAAQARANDMLQTESFSHLAPGCTDLVPRCFLFSKTLKGRGYRYYTAGENLAIYFTNSDQLVDAWMHSPSHRTNIVNKKFTKTGVGIAHGFYQGSETDYVVMLYAFPKNH